MKARPKKTQRAVALLATLLFLLVASSFHSREDNDVATFSGSEQSAGLLSSPTAPDNCPACSLDGVLLARLSVALPFERQTAVEPLVLPTPDTPFVAPRASIDSRPPPQAS